MTPYPKKRPFRSMPFLRWLLTQPSAAPYAKSDPRGEMVYAHQRLVGSAGMAVKPPDTYALPLWTFEHAKEHGGDKSFWGKTKRAMLCVFHVERYLEDAHNIDGWKFILDATTEKMEREGIK